MGILQLAPIERLIRKAGAQRVSDSAVKALAEILEDLAIRITKRALDYTRYAKRKTLSAEDIKLAAQTVLR